MSRTEDGSSRVAAGGEIAAESGSRSDSRVADSSRVAVRWQCGAKRVGAGWHASG